MPHALTALFAILSLASFAHAESDLLAASTITTPEASVETTWVVSGKLYLGGSRTMEADQPATKTNGVTAYANITHSPTQIGLSALGSYTRSSTEEQNAADFDNTLVTLNKNWAPDGSWFSRITAGVSSTLATNISSRDDKTFRGALGPYVEVFKEFGRWTWTQNLSYSRGLYDTSVTFNDAIAPDVVKTFAIVDYNMTEKFYLEGVFQYVQGFAFNGAEIGRSLWNFAAGYSFTKNIAVDGGYGVIAGSAAANGHYDQVGFDAPPAKLLYAELSISM